MAAAQLDERPINESKGDDLLNCLEADLLDELETEIGGDLDAKKGEAFPRNDEDELSAVDMLFAPFSQAIASPSSKRVARAPEPPPPFGDGLEDEAFQLLLDQWPAEDKEARSDTEAPAKKQCRGSEASKHAEPKSVDPSFRDTPIIGLESLDMGPAPATQLAPPEKVVEALGLLGVPLLGVSVRNIERCFRRASLQCHPDKVPKEQRARAMLEFRDLQAAKAVALRWLARCTAEGEPLLSQNHQADDSDDASLFAPPSNSDADSDKDSASDDDEAEDKVDAAACGLKLRGEGDCWSENESGSDDEPLGLSWDAPQVEIGQRLSLLPAGGSGPGCVRSSLDLVTQAHELSRQMAAQMGNRQICGECFEREVEPDDSLYVENCRRVDKDDEHEPSAPVCAQCRVELRKLWRTLNVRGTLAGFRKTV